MIHSQNYREDTMRPLRQSVNRFFVCWRRSHSLLLFSTALTLATSMPIASAQQISPDLYSGMRWRLIGPHRAGRVTAVAGIARQPHEYYFGTPGGGGWKTTDGGRAWKPIFFGAPVASKRSFAVAPSPACPISWGTGTPARG